MADSLLLRGDSLAVLPALPEASAQLILTSPPYNVGWSYADGGDGDRRPLPEYLAFLAGALAGCYHVLRPGGVLALNLPPSIRTPEHRAYPVAAWAQLHLLEQGWLLREPLVWVKARPGAEAYSTSTAIGGPRNPYLRPCHELILLASKESYTMPGKDSKRWPGGAGDFGSYLTLCKDVWSLPPGRASKGEPLAFPEALVSRLVQLYSEPGDVVLDPFAGTGTVGRMARLLGRVAWLVERAPSYWPRLDALLGQGILASVTDSAVPPERICHTCGQAFAGRADATTCSPACRQRAYRARRAG